MSASASKKSTVLDTLGPNLDPTDPADIGVQIRDLRRSRGLSLTELAFKVGRSIGNLSEIERGRSAVTIPVLQKIADALGVTITWFFSGNAVAPLHERNIIVRRDARRALSFEGGGINEELLSPTLRSQIEMVLTTFAPGFGTGGESRARKGEEAGLVLSGVLEIEVDGRIHRLNAGDSFSLEPGGSHHCHNPGDADAVVVWIISPSGY